MLLNLTMVQHVLSKMHAHMHAHSKYQELEHGAARYDAGDLSHHGGNCSVAILSTEGE